MLNSDDDAMIELADALAMRDRGLLPSVGLNDPSGGIAKLIVEVVSQISGNANGNFNPNHQSIGRNGSSGYLHLQAIPLIQT